MVAGQMKWGFFLSTASSFIPVLKKFWDGDGGSYKEKLKMCSKSTRQCLPTPGCPPHQQTYLHKWKGSSGLDLSPSDVCTSYATTCPLRGNKVPS